MLFAKGEKMEGIQEKNRPPFWREASIATHMKRGKWGQDDQSILGQLLPAVRVSLVLTGTHFDES